MVDILEMHWMWWFLLWCKSATKSNKWWDRPKERTGLSQTDRNFYANLSSRCTTLTLLSLSFCSRSHYYSQYLYLCLRFIPHHVHLSHSPHHLIYFSLIQNSLSLLLLLLSAHLCCRLTQTPHFDYCFFFVLHSGTSSGPFLSLHVIWHPPLSHPTAFILLLHSLFLSISWCSGIYHGFGYARCVFDSHSGHPWERWLWCFCHHAESLVFARNPALYGLSSQAKLNFLNAPIRPSDVRLHCYKSYQWTKNKKTKTNLEYLHWHEEKRLAL